MEKLIDDLQRIVRALEILSEKAPPGSEQIDELLDQLFQHKIDLLNLSLNTSSAAYQEAAQGMAAAAAKAERAVKDPARVPDMVRNLEEAIGKLARLLDDVAHAP